MTDDALLLELAQRLEASGSTGGPVQGPPADSASAVRERAGACRWRPTVVRAAVRPDSARPRHVGYDPG